ncbi:MAG: glycoside hydrolase family 1 [Verrucomicrobiae bacterium]|nr:glycoside hydrolase family 1 [Verrucomicrobiae bacterium]
MPSFRIEPNSVKLESVELAGYEEFAESDGYYMDERQIHFFCSQEVLAHNKLDGTDPVFLVGDFNGWGEAIGQSKWQLKPVSVNEVAGLGLSVPRKDFNFNGNTGFKFVSLEGHWFSIPAAASNVYFDSFGNSNYFVDRNRSGQHLLLIETSQPMELDTDFFLHLEEEEPSSCAIMPGEFFLSMQTDLALGAFPYNDSTLFRIFAPRASEVTLVILESPEGWDTARYVSLMRLDDGAWEAVISENLTGKFYWYRINGPSRAGFSHFNPQINVLDPYALAVVNHLGPAIVVDLSNYHPPVPFNPPSETDLVIGEVHLRDLISKVHHQEGGNELKGYLGLAQYLQREGCYLKEWGVNAVELQPIQENDARTPEEYHWGYMTVNFFSPESSYSTNPATAAQVSEFKALVDAFHAAGLAVILDVVYNHVGEPAHLLWVDKLYYFELKPGGELSNWSGCGNDLRCTTPMGKRLIIDSLAHLMEFYGVDGFRFDLAELIGLDTLHEVEAALTEKNPNVILIAEPWSFRGHLGPDLKHSRYFSWNDGYRNFLKDYVKDAGNRDGLRYFLSGSPDGFERPCQTVNYTESHDDRTWLDDITENPEHNGFYPTRLDRRRTHLMASILMMSLGTPMLAQGQDFLRSKWGVRNTYQRGDINALDYQRLIDFSATHSYFRRWMEFRKSADGKGLRLEAYPAKSYFKFFPADRGNGLAVLLNADESIDAPRLFFAVNPSVEPCVFAIPELMGENWVQHSDAERFNETGLKSALIPFRKNLKMPGVASALWILR